MSHGKRTRDKGQHIMAASAGFIRIRRENGQAWQIKCSRCVVRREIGGWPQNMNPDAMVKYMRRLNWVCEFGSEPLCPDCAHRRPHRAITIQAGDVINHAIAKEQEATMATNGSGMDFKLTHKVLNCIQAHFNEKTHRYEPGWSDERVAKETGAHQDIVTKARADVFGEIAEDPAIAKFREDIELCDSQAADLKAFVGDLKSRFEKFVAERKIAGAR